MFGMTKPANRNVTRNSLGARPALRLQARAGRYGVSWKKRIKTAFALLILMTEAVVAVALVAAYMYFQKFSSSLPSVDDMRMDARPPVATTIWSQDGVLLGQLMVVNRQPISLSEMPKSLINATVAIEDRRFFEHPGVDLQGILRATLANATGSNATRQGASTLTQQLVRNVDRFGLTKEKKFSRKIREALYALRMEQLYSKNEIIALYLNNIYYGAGAYGVQAASRTYFGKAASKLNLAECALLAGLPQRPSSFTPFEHRKAALKRRDEVLDNMFKNHYITQSELDAAKAEAPKLIGPQKRKDYNFKAPYFVWYVLNDLIKRYSFDYVQHGLRIETTLNWKQQHMAEQELELGLQNHSDGGSGPNQGALIALDNNTGYIRAMVGGRNYRASQYNNVTMGRRQPGSTFKAFDYAAAFDTGTCDLNDSFPDKPIPYPNDPTKIVKNFSEEGGYSYRDIDCKTAIEFSKNTVAVQVAAKVGINKVIDYAHRMGITSTLQPYLPTALGASEVHPLDLASAYSVFPLKGNRYAPMGLVRVYDRDGNIVEERIPEIHTEILKPHTVEQMDEALEAVVTKGTGTLAREDGQGNIVENARGKTGTTTDSRDAWFAGYTPELTTVIWVAQVHHKNAKHPTWPTYMPMGGVTGGHVCAPIWHNFMMKAVPEQRKFHLPGMPMIAAAPAAPAPPKESDAPVTTPRRRRKSAATATADAATKPKDGALPATSSTDGTAEAPTDENNSPSQETPTPITLPRQQAAPPTSPPALPKPNPQTALRTAAPAPITQAAPLRPQPLQTHKVAPARSVGAITTARVTTRPELPPVEPPHPAPAPRPPTPHVEPKPIAPEMVEVSVCVDTGDKATSWCTAVHSERVTAAQARRMRRCRLHKPPPGEG